MYIIYIAEVYYIIMHYTHIEQHAKNNFLRAIVTYINIDDLKGWTAKAKYSFEEYVCVLRQ